MNFEQTRKETEKTFERLARKITQGNPLGMFKRNGSQARAMDKYIALSQKEDSIEFANFREYQAYKVEQTELLKEVFPEASNEISELIDLVNSMKHRGFDKLDTFAITPQRATKTSAGYDIHSNMDIIIQPNTMETVTTGITAYMMENEFLDLRIRSGLAFNHQLTMQNACGVIDSDYYGKEIKMLVRNESDKPYAILRGDRVAQGIFITYEISDDDMPKSTRDGGFGSTGR